MIPEMTCQRGDGVNGPRISFTTIETSVKNFQVIYSIITNINPKPNPIHNSSRYTHQDSQTLYAITALGLLWPWLCCDPLPRPSVYLANARASAFLQLTFWLPTKLSTVTAMARSMSCAEQ